MIGSVTESSLVFISSSTVASVKRSVSNPEICTLQFPSSDCVDDKRNRDGMPCNVYIVGTDKSTINELKFLIC
jgi:hypothetical protein